MTLAIVFTLTAIRAYPSCFTSIRAISPNMVAGIVYAVYAASFRAIPSK
jgi:hypothetical protein